CGIANLEIDGSITWIKGTFARVRPPEELAYTWTIGSAGAPETLVTVEFLRHANGTEVVLTHERFVSDASRDMHAQGWAACLDELETLLATGRGKRPA